MNTGLDASISTGTSNKHKNQNVSTFFAYALALTSALVFTGYNTLMRHSWKPGVLIIYTNNPGGNHVDQHKTIKSDVMGE